MFCYNNNLLLPLQLNLFVTNGQIYCYGTRTANKYRTHCVVQILRNLLFSTQVLKFGTLFLFQSLVRQIFLALRRKSLTPPFSEAQKVVIPPLFPPPLPPC